MTSADAAVRADGGDAGCWRVRGATVAGVRHRLAGQPGEDAFGWAAGAFGLVLAVADGVSASPEGGPAAEAAVAAAVGAGGGNGEGSGERDLTARCDAALDAAAAAVVARAADGATTLVVAVATDDGRWGAARVGDSDAVVLAGGAWRPAFPPPDDGDGDDGLRTGATDALPSAPASARRHATGALEPGEALVLLSDGVAGPLVDGPTTVAVGLAEELAVVPGPLDIARLVDFERKGCHDDRTLLGAWWVPSP